MSRGRILMVLAALVAAAALCGCNTQGGVQKVSSTPPAPIDAADAIRTLCSHRPVDWDGQPGPDGLMVLVLFFRQGQDLPVTVRGAMEFALYEGAVSAEQIARVAPARTWSFQGAQLRGCLARTVWGWGYSVRLGWGQTAPKTSSVTLLIKHVPPDGPTIYAEPLLIPLGPR